MKSDQRAIFIGAHPDDIEIACGGTLFRFVQAGYDVHCYILTRGEKCGSPMRREQESYKALTEVLGVPEKHVHFEGANRFTDTKIPANGETLEYLREIRQAARRDGKIIHAVFSHSKHDHHQDHRAVASCVATAFQGVMRLYYESPSINMDEFQPWVNYEISEEGVERKYRAIQCHTSQLKRNRWYFERDSIITPLKCRALRLEYCHYVEIFEGEQVCMLV